MTPHPTHQIPTCGGGVSGSNTNGKKPSIRERLAAVRMPPVPHPVDPRGPEETDWPRGWNFGNIVFAVCGLVVVLLVALTLLTRH